MQLLLTEDDAQLGEALQDILVSNGHAVTWVRSGEDAQRFVQSDHFDLMLPNGHRALAAIPGQGVSLAHRSG